MRCIFVAALGVFAFSGGCVEPGLRAGPSLQANEVALYGTLRSLASSSELILSEAGNVAIGRGRTRRVVAWVSTGSPIGEGVIGVFDSDSRVEQWVRTDPLLRCWVANVRGVGQCVCYVEHATGTGQRVETLRVTPVDALDHTVWACETYVWEEGLAGRNPGRHIDRVALALDLGSDGSDEIVVVETTRDGADDAPIPPRAPAVKFDVFRYSHVSRKFEPTALPIRLLSDTPMD